MIIFRSGFSGFDVVADHHSIKDCQISLTIWDSSITLGDDHGDRAEYQCGEATDHGQSGQAPAKISSQRENLRPGEGGRSTRCNPYSQSSVRLVILPDSELRERSQLKQVRLRTSLCLPECLPYLPRVS